MTNETLPTLPEDAGASHYGSVLFQAFGRVWDRWDSFVQ